MEASNKQCKKYKHVSSQMAYIPGVSSLKQNHPAPTISSSKVITSFIKFNGRYDINCKYKIQEWNKVRMQERALKQKKSKQKLLLLEDTK